MVQFKRIIRNVRRAVTSRRISQKQRVQRNIKSIKKAKLGVAKRVRTFAKQRTKSPTPLVRKLPSVKRTTISRPAIQRLPSRPQAKRTIQRLPARAQPRRQITKLVSTPGRKLKTTPRQVRQRISTSALQRGQQALGGRDPFSAGRRRRQERKAAKVQKRVARKAARKQRFARFGAGFRGLFNR